MKRLIAAAALTVAPFAAFAEDDALVTYQSLSPASAQKAATAGLEYCRAQGYQVAIAVTDRFGLPLAILRDRFAGAHTVDTATRKAWTSASFRTDTLELAGLAEKGEMWGLRGVTNALPLGGGLPINNGDGSLVGAVGVSGAPGGDLDKDCAEAAISAIEDDIAF